MIEAAQNGPSGGSAVVGWILLSTLYALLVGSPFKTNHKKHALYCDDRSQIYFKQSLGWLHPRSSVAVTDRDLLIFTNPWMNTLLLFGAFDTPVTIPRAKILATRFTSWFFGFVRAVEVEYDNAGEREVVQLATQDSDRLLMMLANTRSAASENIADEREDAAR
ncbi:MAG: hypothetical protein JNL06_11955 [Alphaproteobacteria bacterium]|nr:hypothetical protein [Alphaproteobacteria bacterium]